MQNWVGAARVSDTGGVPRCHMATGTAAGSIVSVRRKGAERGGDIRWHLSLCTLHAWAAQLNTLSCRCTLVSIIMKFWALLYLKVLVFNCNKSSTRINQPKFLLKMLFPILANSKCTFQHHPSTCKCFTMASNSSVLTYTNDECNTLCVVDV